MLITNSNSSVKNVLRDKMVDDGVVLKVISRQTQPISIGKLLFELELIEIPLNDIEAAAFRLESQHKVESHKVFFLPYKKEG